MTGHLPCLSNCSLNHLKRRLNCIIQRFFCYVVDHDFWSTQSSKSVDQFMSITQFCLQCCIMYIYFSLWVWFARCICRSQKSSAHELSICIKLERHLQSHLINLFVHRHTHTLCILRLDWAQYTAVFDIKFDLLLLYVSRQRGGEAVHSSRWEPGSSLPALLTGLRSLPHDQSLPWWSVHATPQQHAHRWVTARPSHDS